MKKPKESPVRRWLELVGALLLLYGVYSQRHVLTNSLSTIRHASEVPTIACFALSWFLFVWSALGYRILLQKSIKLHLIMLAHLAAGGPGRVIPGGAGYLSIGTLFLRKSGLKLSNALAIALTSNLAGLIVNVAVLCIVFIASPSLLRSLHISAKNALILLAITAVIVGILAVARRSKKVKKGTDEAGKEFKKLWQRLLHDPLRLLGLIGIMLATILTNSFMLYLAAHAVGLHLPLISALVAMSTGVALGSLVPTPGGIGGVEAGLIVSMHALGFNIEIATSAALLYRAATYLQPFIPGIGAYFYLRKKQLL